MGKHDDAERVKAASLADWAAWLAAHHADRDGVWLLSPPRESGPPPVGYESAVVEALRYGWIDAVTRKLEDGRRMQWFSPRRKGSGWARSNKARIERLEAEGRLEPAGRAVVEAARADGSWTLFDEVEDLVVPADLATALADRPGAGEAWERLTPSVRKMMLGWVVTAKRPETRRRRITEIAEQAAHGRAAGPAAGPAAT